MPVALLTLLIGLSCGPTKGAIECEMPGEWAHTAGAEWVARVIAASGYERTGCTGSGFVIDTGGEGFSGHDLYVSGWRGRSPTNYSRRRIRVSGVEIQYDQIRGVWKAGDRVVWIEAGPTTRALPPMHRLRRLVRASLAVD